MNDTKAGIARNCLGATLGLMLFGLGVHLVIRADIGAAPWDVFCIGLSTRAGILYGNASIAISVFLIVTDLLIGERIGLGTLLDALVVGKTVDLLNWLDIVPRGGSLPASLAMMAAGLMIEGYSQYLYMRAGLCCGPRDSLQIGLGRRVPRLPIGAVNVGIQATVLLIGWRLGGPVGVGTLIAPLAIGATQQLCFHWARFDPKTVTHQDLFASIRVLLHRDPLGRGRAAS